MIVKDHLILFARKAIRICVVLLMLLSITNGFIFQCIESTGFDFIEYTDFAEGETERESEKESEKEGIDDEFWKTANSEKYASLNQLINAGFHCYYRSNAYLDISTPPPELS